MVLSTPQTWVFLRGLTRESGHWGSFVQAFEAGVPDSHVICIDIPGSGYLHTQPSPTTINRMMGACHDQLLAAGARAPYSLFGMSMGAMVALSWSSAFSDEVQACVLVNSSMKPFSPFYQRLKPANYLRLLQLGLSRATDDQWERAILDMTSNVKNESILPAWLDLRRQHPITRTNAIRQLWAASRFRAPEPMPSAPTLVLTSSGDELVSSTCSRAIAQQGNWPVQIHPTAGHDLPLDDAAWVVDQVRDWLRGSQSLVRS